MTENKHSPLHCYTFVLNAMCHIFKLGVLCLYWCCIFRTFLNLTVVQNIILHGKGKLQSVLKSALPFYLFFLFLKDLYVSSSHNRARVNMWLYFFILLYAICDNFYPLHYELYEKGTYPKKNLLKMSYTRPQAQV